MLRDGIPPLLLFAACLSQPAFAQINTFRGTARTLLNAHDVAALSEATNRLDRPQLTLGASEAWNNPTSGASGTIAAGQAVRREGLAFRIVDYQVTVRGARA